MDLLFIHNMYIGHGSNERLSAYMGIFLPLNCGLTYSGDYRIKIVYTFYLHLHFCITPVLTVIGYINLNLSGLYVSFHTIYIIHK